MRFVFERLASAILVVLAVTLLAFGAMNLLGDPLFNILGPIADEASGPEFEQVRNEARAEYHLDDPFVLRYGRWLGDLAQGDFGRSFANQTDVADILGDKLPPTLALMVMAQVLALAVAIPWSLWAASRADATVDKASTVVSFSMLAIPIFALSVLTFWLFVVTLDLFPTRYDDSSLWTQFRSLFLPAATLSIPLIATYQRVLRTDIIDTLQQDYIAVAKAKGLSRTQILFRHALRPSLFSLMTVVGIQIGTMIGGSVVVERQFSIPGIGSEIVEAIIRDDFPVVLAVVVVVSVVFAVVNFAIDILYGLIDPRVSTSG